MALELDFLRLGGDLSLAILIFSAAKLESELDDCYFLVFIFLGSLFFFIVNLLAFWYY